MRNLFFSRIFFLPGATALIVVLSFQWAVAGPFDEPDIPTQEVFNLNKLLEQADITEEGDINSDGVTDYIIRYRNSASSYGEFLYNVIISDGTSYRRGLSSDDYFVDLHFQEDQVVGIRRESATTARQHQYFYDAVQKVLEEK